MADVSRTNRFMGATCRLQQVTSRNAFFTALRQSVRGLKLGICTCRNFDQEGMSSVSSYDSFRPGRCGHLRPGQAASGRKSRRQRIALSLFGTLLMLAVSTCAFAAPLDGITGPGSQGPERWRVAYYQGGEYSEYHDLLLALADNLGQRGLIDASSLPDNPGKAARPVWEWLAAEDRSTSGLEFPADGFYDAGWDEGKRELVRRSLLARLRYEDDIDLVLAFGTWAGKDLANDLHDTPVLVISASDAVGAGIVASIEDSGFDHVHAHLDPERFERQVRLFHLAVGFRSLGVAYEDSAAGRSYAGISNLESLAGELGFEVVPCYTLSDIADQARAADSFINCVKKLSGSADALYVTEQGGVNEQSLPAIVEAATAYRLATFSQRGIEDVRAGLLLSMARGSSLRSLGNFHAHALIRVMEGARPRDLQQVFEPPSNLAINLQTANAIGYMPSADILVSADELYGRSETGY
jgi:ABC-type uncharacterized transport system substrate-binding protein